ncbi:MAG: hypothetical protein GWN71_09545, partial [Gammaproteobacteria bacterium]|nr:hypothetical protein [Gemmatimonadota bacterium]NIU73808.1 hypothetical protein [Gammaproteobacteria bacterium]
MAILNDVAGNVGGTVRFDRRETGTRAGTFRDLRALIAAIRSGDISTLLVHGANPLHSVPGEGDLRAAFDGIDFMASFTPYLDETTARAHLLLPDHHFLE